MGRIEARETAFKLIFQYAFTMDENEEILQEYLTGIGSDDAAYISEVYHGVINHYDELVAEISKVIENFEMKRLFKVDTTLLLLALYEIKYMPDIPYKATVNSVLNLAEKYSTEKSSKYINGVLSKFAR